MPTDLLILLSPKNIIFFIIIFTRLGGLMASAPLYSKYPIPHQIKAWLLVFITFVMFPLISAKMNFQVPNSMPELTIILMKEFLIGYIVGFVANLVFIGAEMAAELLSLQTGLSAAQALNPVSGSNSPVLTQFYTLMIAMVFISLNAHQWLFSAIYQSFSSIPPGYEFVINGTMTKEIIFITGQLFMVALGIAMPIFSVLLITDVLLGFSSKMMPQINIFMVAMPIKIYIGLILVIMFLQPMYEYMTVLVQRFMTGIMVIIGG